MTYVAPQIRTTGTVRGATRASLFGGGQDNLTWILPIFGEEAEDPQS